MMGENEVLSAAVDVEGSAQVFQRHGGALDVPTRPPRAPGALPGRLPRFGGLPQRKVQRVALAVIHLHPGPRLQLLQVAPRQFAIARHPVHLKVDIPIDHVGVPPVHQTLHHLQDLWDVFGHPGIVIGA